MKPLYAFAALALCVNSLTHANEDDAPVSSAPSCEVGQPADSGKLSPELLAAAKARFMQLCLERHGTLVYDGDSRLVHNITKPGKLTGLGVEKFLPALTTSPYNHGTVVLSYVVEIDCRTSSAAVLKSSGIPSVDDGALKFVGHLSCATPAYLDFTQVGFYTIVRIRY